MDHLSHDFFVPDIRKPGQSLLRQQISIPLVADGLVDIIVAGACRDRDGNRYSVQLRISGMSCTGRIRLYAPDARDAAAPHIILTPLANGLATVVYSYSTPSDGACPIDSGILLGFKIALRALCDDLIVQAGATGHPHLIKKNPPPLDAEMFKRLAAVYNNGAFMEFYDPAHDYDESCTFAPFDSIYGGEFQMDPEQNFANVIGSSGDPKINNKNWIVLWRDQFGPAPYCASWEYLAFDCTESGPYGGHVIDGKVADKVKVGADHVAFIIPICPNHNNNDATYMAPLDTQDAIWLDHYFKKN